VQVPSRPGRTSPTPDLLGPRLQRQCTHVGHCAACGERRPASQRRAWGGALPGAYLPHETTGDLQLALAPPEGQRESGPGHDFSRVRIHAAAPTQPGPSLLMTQPGDASERAAERLATAVVAAPALMPNPLPPGPRPQSPGRLARQPSPML